MKQKAYKIVRVLLILMLTVGIFSACKDSNVPEQTGEQSETESMRIPESFLGAPYRIDYLNIAGQEGNCIARLVLNPNWKEDFTVEVPEKSPNGDTVIVFERHLNNFGIEGVPSILSEKTYQEKILKPLCEAWERGEIEHYGESQATNNFYVGKITSLFQEKNPSKFENIEDREVCIKAYPITDPNGVNIPIRVFAKGASLIEIRLIQSYLEKYTSFSVEDIQTEHLYFQTEIQKSNLSDETKMDLLKQYQFYENKHFAKLVLPDSLLWVNYIDLLGYDQLFQTENGISYISNWAVDGDTNFAHITLRDGTVGIAAGAISDFRGKGKTITIPASLKVVCSPFECENIHISDVAAWIGIAQTNYSAESLALSDSIGGIGSNYNLYLHDTILTNLIIPDGVTKISPYAFSGCESLKSITIPDSVTSIGFSAFSGCNRLEDITIPFVGATKDGNGNTFLGYIFGASFDRWNKWDNNSKCIPSSLKTVVITGGTSIGDSAFLNCRSLTNIMIPNCVRSIGNFAFHGCEALASITIPDSVTSIGDSAINSERDFQKTQQKIPNKIENSLQMIA